MRIRGRRKANERGGSLRIGYLACNLCDHYMMGHSIYVILLGLIGTIITAFDIIRIMNKNVTRQEKQSGHCRSKETVPPDMERDLKLMTSILGIEHYTLIMLGAITVSDISKISLRVWLKRYRVLVHCSRNTRCCIHPGC
ncbi:uncharacterized protein LOC143215090 isoform X2 [Lasioglossum baleicum]|uniref:uncharacterized protein LOC143215090 isoform X2 n=1 Tax=Lasioglossum baleicum TaxID=434251 RepID=UPI003FCD1FF5